MAEVAVLYMVVAGHSRVFFSVKSIAMVSFHEVVGLTSGIHKLSILLSLVVASPSNF